MKMKLIILPILALTFLSSCTNNATVSSKKVSFDQEYYLVYHTNSSAIVRPVLAKSDFYIFKKDYFYHWHYTNETFVVTIYQYKTSGDILFYRYYFGMMQTISISEINYGNKTIYNELISKAKEADSKNYNDTKTNNYGYLGNLDHGSITYIGASMHMYLTYSIAKELGYMD